jgi:hypothetical protein
MVDQNNDALLGHIHDMRFEAIFREIKNLLEKEAVPLLLLKGPHLAHSIYDRPSERSYVDLDILVKPADFYRAARILRANKFALLEDGERALATAAQANHWAFTSRFGQLIELHRSFTGLNRHPGDIGEWFARAETFKFGQTEALGLGAEDLLCHLCLHIGKSFFYLIEEKHIRDLDRVIRGKKIRWEIFIERCRETRSMAIAYYCLLSTRARHGTPIPALVLSTLRPGGFRRRWLARHLDVAAFPVYRYQARGVSHARLRLTLPLLDGIAGWPPFLIRAAWIKGLDVVLRIPVLGRLWNKSKTGDRS